ANAHVARPRAAALERASISTAALRSALAAVHEIGLRIDARARAHGCSGCALTCSESARGTHGTCVAAFAAVGAVCFEIGAQLAAHDFASVARVTAHHGLSTVIHFWRQPTRVDAYGARSNHPQCSAYRRNMPIAKLHGKNL